MAVSYTHLDVYKRQAGNKRIVQVGNGGANSAERVVGHEPLSGFARQGGGVEQNERQRIYLGGGDGRAAEVLLDVYKRQVVGRVIDAADSARIIDDAVRLAALEHGQAHQRPPVDYLAGQLFFVGQVGRLEDVVDADDVGAVEVRRAVAAAQVQSIVAVVEQAQPCLLYTSRCV